MRKTLVLSLAAFGLIASASVSTAQPHSPWYIDAGIGLNKRFAANDEIALASFKRGEMFSLGVGYRLGDKVNLPVVRHLRLEVEYARQQNDLDKLWAYPLGGYPKGEMWGTNSGRAGLRSSPVPVIANYYSSQFSYPEKARGSIDYETFQFLVYYDVKFEKFTLFLGVGNGAGRSILKNLATPFLDYIAAPGSPIRTNAPGNILAAPNGSRYDLSYTTDWRWTFSPRAGVTVPLNKRFEVVGEVRYWTAPDRVEVHAYPEIATDAGGNITHPNVDGWSFELKLRYNL